jgi:BCCT family betaine/carnitine transporter
LTLKEQSMENAKIDRIIFTVSIMVIMAICIPLVIFPEGGTEIVNKVFNFVTSQFGVIYLWAGIACLGFLLWLSFSRHGSIVLGFDDEKPQFSLYSWVCMLFCAGVATGILYLGTIEWSYYYKSPPYGTTPGSAEAINWASTYGMFHWGLTGWAFYALPAVAIGYFYYIKKVPYMRLSTSCYGLLGERAEKFPGRVIDITFMFGMIGSVGTSIGLGTPMISAGISRLFGFDGSFGLNLIVVLIVTVIFASTVYVGIEKGIKRLADINMALAIFLLLFVLFAGPTVFILKMGTNSIGTMFQNFIRMSTWTDPLTESRFVEDWTVFYWAWWIAVGPFMGIFLAQISRGRSIRQVVLGSLFFGSFGCAIYYIILGNYALHLEINNIVSITETLAQNGAPTAIITVIASLPLGKVILLLFCVVSIIFMATTYNSSSYAMASCASSKIRKDQNPAKWHRLFWAFALVLLPLTLMWLGDLDSEGFKSKAFDSLKTASLVVSLPLLLVFVIMAVSLLKSLRENEQQDVTSK